MSHIIIIDHSTLQTWSSQIPLQTHSRSRIRYLVPDSIPYGGKVHEWAIESTREWDFPEYVENMDSATLSLIVTILSVREIVFSKKTWKHTRTCTRHSGHFLALSRVDFETPNFGLPVLCGYQYNSLSSPDFFWEIKRAASNLGLGFFHTNCQQQPPEALSRRIKLALSFHIFYSPSRTSHVNPNWLIVELDCIKRIPQKKITFWAVGSLALISVYKHTQVQTSPYSFWLRILRLSLHIHPVSRRTDSRW